MDERIVGMDAAPVTLTPVTASDYESALREVRRILEAGIHGSIKRPSAVTGLERGHLGPGHAEMHCLLWDALDVTNAALKEETAWTQPDPALGERNEYKEEHE